ncbi:MAG: L-threonylcarbamoyladenylate synthase [Halobacteriales archaeon]|nr:L-threonylcarbamoyladenylate synthase [Halobacteriales archaeon]
MSTTITEAALAIRDGDAVVYPTETVYGLGADALDPAAIDRVYGLKGRSRDNPLSFAVPDISTALEYVAATELDHAFMQAFLPGPVTVICAATPAIPRELTAGRDRVGVRIPDNDLALELLAEVAPITATSANKSGSGSVTHPSGLDPELREAVGAVIDGGETPGTESTVVDPSRNEIHRRGAMAGAVEAWLQDQHGD